MDIAWITDPHLNFVTEEVMVTLARAAGIRAEAMLITGDIAESKSLLRCLKIMQAEFKGPIYFVAGNHDFYGCASIATAEETFGRSRAEPLTYLTSSGVIELSPGVALVGDDGWYDGRNGNMMNSQGNLTMELCDFSEIPDLKASMRGIGAMGLQIKLKELGDRAVARVRPKLVEALAKYKHVIFATHVPPFAGAAWYKGKPSESYAQPFFSSKCMGDMIFELTGENPDKQVTVLCGHSHFYGLYKPDANLEVYTGYAKYYNPCIMRILEVGDDTLTMHSVK